MADDRDGGGGCDCMTETPWHILYTPKKHYKILQKPQGCVKDSCFLDTDNSDNQTN